MSILKKIFVLFIIVSASVSSGYSQNIDFTKSSTLGNLYIRMYGELHYYQPINTRTYTPGKFDAKRMVALFGYQFDRNTQFVTEWELEHGNEIFLEQAFIKHKVAGNTAIKAGMILIPMGIINENHEPNNFYSVDRPTMDVNLVPTTWRDIGIGVNGLFPALDLRYQLYLVNGLISYKDSSAKFNQSSMYRSGRQKGIKTIFSGLPSLSGQLEYYGFSNGKLGLSIYSGESNTDAFKGLARNDTELTSQADSTTVYTNMVGLHSSNTWKKWTLRSQLIFSHNIGAEKYNVRTGSDLSTAALGLYSELGRTFTKDGKWLAFGRYSYLDNKLESSASSYNEGLTHILTAGINYFAAKGAVFKLDFQAFHSADSWSYQANTGIGVWF